MSRSAEDAAEPVPVPPKGNGTGDNDRGGSKRRRRAHIYKGLITSGAFLASMRPPTYVVDGLIERGKAYTLTGRTGHGKTLLLLLLAIKVVCGDWFCGRKCQQGTVAFFAGENSENVKVQFYGMCAELGVVGAELQIVWHEGVFDIDDARKQVAADLAQYPDLAFIAFDSQQAFFLGDDDNANMAMLDLAAAFRKVSADHPSRPATVIAAHPIKNAARDNLLPRGGSSVVNELDGNLTSWLDTESNIVSLHWQGKFRGIYFDPIKLESVVIKPRGLLDGEGNQMPCTVLRALGERREAELEGDSIDREKAILQAMLAEPKISQNAMATKLSLSRTNVQRSIKTLKERKWVRQMWGKWVLTTAAKTALKTDADEA